MGYLNESATDRLRNRINGRVLPSSNGHTKPKAKAGKRQTVKAWESLNHFYLEAMKGLTRSEIAAFVVVWSVEKDVQAAVSLSTVAQCGGMSRQAAQTAIKSLMDKGLLVRISKGSNVTNKSSVYRTSIPPQT